MKVRKIEYVKFTDGLLDVMLGKIMIGTIIKCERDNKNPMNVQSTFLGVPFQKVSSLKEAKKVIETAYKKMLKIVLI